MSAADKTPKLLDPEPMVYLPAKRRHVRNAECMNAECVIDPRPEYVQDRARYEEQS